jgi:hypothetical protein
LFADDGTCLAKDRNQAALIEYVNKELQKIANWFHSNKMAVNTAKTKFILFRTKGKFVDENLCKVIFNNNELGQPNVLEKMYEIERIHNAGVTRSFKLLGVHFDEYLSFEDHINSICSKISKSLYIINRSKNFLPKKALLTLYYALIHSHLSYCTAIFGCANKTSLAKLVIKQKKAVRVIANAQYRAHTRPIFKELKILPLEQMITFSKLKFMHKFMNNRLPFSFTNCWVSNRERNPERVLRNANDLYIIPHQYGSLTRLPIFSFPLLWNQEDVTKQNPNMKIYPKSLKSKLLNNL